MKLVSIEIEIKEYGIDDIEVGDLLEYDGDVIRFSGYDYGTYPFGVSIITGETIDLPWR